MFSFFCRVISHMYIVISLKRLQNAKTTNNKKLEIYTQICKRNGTNSQHEKTFWQISHVFHTNHSCS